MVYDEPILTKEQIKEKIDELNVILSDLKTLKLGLLLTDQKYKSIRNISIRYEIDVFSAEMGAEAVSGVTYGGIGERSGFPPTDTEISNVARSLFPHKS